MNEYEPCPECGAKNYWERDAISWVQVSCGDCRAEGPKAATPEAARIAWNEWAIQERSEAGERASRGD